MDELYDVLEKSLRRQELTDDDLLRLLNCNDRDELKKLFAAARAVRFGEFGNQVFLYGFVYFSTYCHNNCGFCYYRRENRLPRRYRKSSAEIVATAEELKASGVHLLDLTMGEDDYFLENDAERLIELVRTVKHSTGLPIMVSPGVVSVNAVRELAEAGADWYALYQETHNERDFVRLRIAQDYGARMAAKSAAARSGLLLEEGLMVGLGESPEDIVKSFHMMKRLCVSQGRCMTFIPQHGTPLEGRERAAFDMELKIIAALRLYLPELLIPASLDVDGRKGLKERLLAGANVVTSIIPPRKGYAGVANAVQDIDEGFRTVDGIRDTLTECGMVPASAEEYVKWVEKRKNSLEGRCGF